MPSKHQFSVDELWVTTYQWLSSCGARVSKSFLKEEMIANPEYPALSSLADVLNAGNMKYEAIRSDHQYIGEFNYPLLAHVNTREGDQGLVVVKQPGDWKESGELANNWTGVIVMPEKNARWKHAGNDISLRDDKKKKAVAVFSLAGFLLLTLFTLVRQPGFWVAGFALLSVIGIALSWMTFSLEIGLQSQLAKQVCSSMGSANGCEMVLKSKHARWGGGISPADAALVWFITQWIFFMIGSWVTGLDQFRVTAIQFSLAGILVAGWSLLTQKFVLKQWCALCLGLVSILVLQFAVAVGEWQASFHFPTAIGYLLLQPVLLLVAIQPLKKLLKVNLRQRGLQRQLRRWRQNANVFTGLWNQQGETDCRAWSHDLQIGDPKGAVQITVACNPYCTPCANAHKKLDELVERHAGDLGVTIRFSVDASDKDSKRTQAVQMILQGITAGSAGNLQSPGRTKKTLSDWFEWMDESKWKERYGKFTQGDVETILKQHGAWAKEAGVAFTPTIFIQGREMPGQYTIDDIGQLLPDLIEMRKGAHLHQQ